MTSRRPFFCRTGTRTAARVNFSCATVVSLRNLLYTRLGLIESLILASFKINLLCNYVLRTMDTRTWTLPQFFLFGCVLSYHIPGGQGSVLPDLLYCPAGTYLSQGHFGGRVSCQPCFDGYYNSKNRHRDTECSACILYNEYDPTQALVSRCNATHNTVIKCIDGFFLDIEGGWLSCESCKDCRLWGK